LEFEGELIDAHVEEGKGAAGVLVADIGAETDSGGGVQALDPKAVSAVGHDPEKFAGFAEDKVAAGWIEFSEQALEKIVVQLEIIRRGEVNLKSAFAIISFFGSNQDGVLKFEGIAREPIDFAAKLPGFRGG